LTDNEINLTKAFESQMNAEGNTAEEPNRRIGDSLNRRLAVLRFIVNLRSFAVSGSNALPL